MSRGGEVRVRERSRGRKVFVGVTRRGGVE